MLKSGSNFFKYTALSALLLLGGCSTLTSLETPTTAQHYRKEDWAKRKTQLETIQNWNSTGAVSIHANQQTNIGSFVWSQRGPHSFNIQLSGPLNIAGIRIAGNPGRVTLWRSGQIAHARTAEALMQQQLGWYLPVSNLYYWVRGLPAPVQISQNTFDRYGHLTQLVQQGWHIQYQAYQSYRQVDLPRVIILSNPRIHVKMVIRNWQVWK